MHAPTPENPFIEVGQAHLKMFHSTVVQNMGVMMGDLRVPPPTLEFEISIICIGYRPVKDGHRIVPTPWNVLMYTHG